MKMQSLAEESKLYHQELQRTQQINRDFFITNQKGRSNASQSISRTIEVGSRQQDSLTYDSVMSSTQEKWNEVPRKSFWQSVDRKP
jgi:hypothetical protein